MKQKPIKLADAVRFHGHLGPFLVLGLKMGEVALKKLKFKKYFGLEVIVRGAGKKPKSCLVDGLQLSTGATLGKGNIEKFPGKIIEVNVKNLSNGSNLTLVLKDELSQLLDSLKTHKQSQLFARKLYKTSAQKLFNLKIQRKV
jgi:formylmethanofuran dehydrogenase subunit E